MSYDIDVILKEIEKFTPESGVNLVGIDNFEPPGEMLYLISHFDKYETALEAQKNYHSDSVIYPAKQHQE